MVGKGWVNGGKGMGEWWSNGRVMEENWWSNRGRMVIKKRKNYRRIKK